MYPASAKPLRKLATNRGLLVKLLRKPMCEREVGNLLAVSKHCVVAHENACLCFGSQHIVERRGQIVDPTERPRKDFHSTSRSRCPDTLQRCVVSRKRRAPEHGGARH